MSPTLRLPVSGLRLPEPPVPELRRRDRDRVVGVRVILRDSPVPLFRYVTKAPIAGLDTPSARQGHGNGGGVGTFKQPYLRLRSIVVRCVGGGGGRLRLQAKFLGADLLHLARHC